MQLWFRVHMQCLPGFPSKYVYFFWLGAVMVSLVLQAENSGGDADPSTPSVFSGNLGRCGGAGAAGCMKVDVGEAACICNPTIGSIKSERNTFGIESRNKQTRYPTGMRRRVDSGMQDLRNLWQNTRSLTDGERVLNGCAVLFPTCKGGWILDAAQARLPFHRYLG